MLLKLITLVPATLLALTVSVGPAAAHPHVVSNPDHTQVLANGQNHPGFQQPGDHGLRLSCQDTLEPVDSGPAGWGLETAHHGPDAGTPGRADDCYATVGDPVDNNPAID